MAAVGKHCDEKKMVKNQRRRRRRKKKKKKKKKEKAHSERGAKKRWMVGTCYWKKGKVNVHVLSVIVHLCPRSAHRFFFLYLSLSLLIPFVP